MRCLDAPLIDAEILLDKRDQLSVAHVTTRPSSRSWQFRNSSRLSPIEKLPVEPARGPYSKPPTKKSSGLHGRPQKTIRNRINLFLPLEESSAFQALEFHRIAFDFLREELSSPENKPLLTESVLASYLGGAHTFIQFAENEAPETEQIIVDILKAEENTHRVGISPVLVPAFCSKLPGWQMNRLGRILIGCPIPQSDCLK